MSKLKQPYLWPLLLLIVANGLILADITGLRYGAALVLLAFLPGWAWLNTFLQRPLDLAERLTLAIGLSLALTIVGAIVTVYLPGPLTLGQLLLTSDTLIIAGLVMMWRQQRRPFSPGPPISRSAAIFMALLLLLLAALLRLPGLGYAEFHEDEAEALMLGVRLVQGEDYALFLHRKGPAQMLLPVAFWLFSGHISESLARLPFALSSLLSVVTIYFLGRRWFGWTAGIAAGLLWAINGYAIAFGRMVQYQALIFFLGPLALYCLYLAWQDRQPRLQIVAAILLAACLLAHFDALLLLPAAGYLFIKSMADEEGKKKIPFQQNPHLTTAILSLTLFLGLLASFYVPYLLDPEFQNTANYLAESRVKPGLLYNNLLLLSRLDADYSSRFYLPVLALGVISYVVWQSRNYSPIWRWGLVGLGLLLVSTGWLSQAWQVGPLNLAVLPWGVGLVGLWLTANDEAKAGWLMFGAALVGYVFLVDDPRTHLYILYPGAALLAGAGWGNLRFGNYDFRLARLLTSFVAIAAALLSGSVILYESFIFLSTESALNQFRIRWEGSVWETVYNDLPQARSYFGYPKVEGWKAIGALRAEGQFPGDFRSVNEDFVIPIWYNYGEPRSCYDTPTQFFVRAAGYDVNIPVEHIQEYDEVGWVESEGEVRLRIFSAKNLPKNSPTSEKIIRKEGTAPTVYSLEDLASAFDQRATPQQFIQQAEPSRRLETQFGPAIGFVGYDLPRSSVAPGDTLHVNLYWQATAPPAEHYRAFVHLTDGSTLWAQQDEEPACRLPTSIWRTGQRGLGQFRLPVSPDTPPGRYPLVIGLYQADTLERLKITAGAGQIGDDFLWLGDVEIMEDVKD